MRNDEYSRLDWKASDIVTDYRNGESVQTRTAEFLAEVDAHPDLNWGERFQLKAILRQALRQS